MAVQENCYGSIVIKPGGAHVLPSGAQVVATNATEATIESTCQSVIDALADAQADLNCYELVWEADDADDGAGGGAASWEGYTVSAIEILGQKFTLNINQDYPVAQLDLLVNKINTTVPSGIILIDNVSATESNDKVNNTICFRTFDIVASTIKLEFKNPRNADSTDPAIMYTTPRPSTGQFCQCVEAQGT